MPKPKTWKARNTRQRFEQYARHPRCEANVVSAVLDVPMHYVAEQERPNAGTFGQSPFALAHGVTFEKALFAKNAERLRTGLSEVGVIPSADARFVDLRLRANGGPMAELDDAARESSKLLASLTAPSKELLAQPTLIAGAAFLLPGQPVLLPQAMLALDALVIRPGDGGGFDLIVGEVKTYADRAGFTDHAELATARAQAGVYAHALQVALDAHQLRDRVAVSSHGFLVLAQPGSAFPKIRAREELRYQAHRAERGLDQLRAVAKSLASTFTEPPGELQTAAVLGAKTCYRDSCVSFCERAERCHEEAFHAGDPAVLGEEARRFLGSVSLHRAADLLAGARPTTPAERSFVDRARVLDEVSQ